MHPYIRSLIHSLLLHSLALLLQQTIADGKDEPSASSPPPAVAAAADPPVTKTPVGQDGVDGWFDDEGDEEEDDDWDKPMNTRSLIELDDEYDESERTERDFSEVVRDSQGVVGLLRKRLSQNVPLTPAEIKEFEEGATRLRKDK